MVLTETNHNFSASTGHTVVQSYMIWFSDIKK